MEGQKSYKTIIAQAELMAMAPDAVALFLMARAGNTKGDPWSDPIDAPVEAQLLARNEPRITLALARYGRFVETLKPLFQNGEPDGAIRLAVLSNSSVEGSFFPQFPVALFDRDEQAAAWLATASGEALKALFENERLNDGFLRDLLEAKAPWNTIPDEQRARIVIILHRNARMRTPYDDEWLDGYADYSHNAVFDAAWSLAAKVEPTSLWATALRYLYEALVPYGPSVGKPLEVCARWQLDPADTEGLANEAKENGRGWLSHHQGVRKGLARLAVKSSSSELLTLLQSDDLALRAAAYAAGALDSAQIVAAYDRDGELFFNQALDNLHLWRSRSQRDALSTVAWSVSHNDKSADLTAVNLYNSTRKRLREQHREWFTDEADNEPELVSADAPATKADVNALSAQLNELAVAGTLDQLKAAISSLNSRLGWVWWFSLGALVATLLHG